MQPLAAERETILVNRQNQAILELLDRKCKGTRTYSFFIKTKKAGCMVVKIFLDSGDTEYPLTNQGVEFVANLLRCPRIMQYRCQAAHQAMMFVDFTRQKQPSTGGNMTTGEIRVLFFTSFVPENYR